MSKKLHNQASSKLPMLLLLMLLTFLPAQLSARDFDYTYEGQTLTYTVLDEDAKTVSVGPYSKISGDLIIPSQVSDESNTYSVTTIGNEAFNRCTGLTSVTIPNSVTNIGHLAFYSCAGLTFVSIPNSVTTIGQHAFCFCASLTSVTLPNSVTNIDYCTFLSCTGLTSVTIGDSVTTIGRYAFDGCSSLSSVTIPNSVTTIGECAFRDCYSLTSVTIGNSMTTIGQCAFLGCKKLISVTIPNAVTTIEDRAFSNCSKLAAFTAGASLESIRYGAFEYCALTEIVLPPHVQTIGDNVFDGNDIKSIVLGSEVTKIGGNAFGSANQLDGVSITALTPPVAGSNTFSNYDCPLYVMPSANDEVKNAYANDANCWHNFVSRELVPADRVEIEGKDVISLHPGETVALSAAVVPADASLPYIFWRSTNPSFATVDNEGIVTLVDNGSKGRLSDESCDIIAETLYANVFASIKVKDANTEIEDIAIDVPAPTSDIFTLQGICVKRNASQADIDALNPGLYIVGGRKVLVK